MTEPATRLPWVTALLGVILGLSLGWLTTSPPYRSLDTAVLGVERLSEEVASTLGQTAGPLARVSRLASLLAANPAATHAPASVKAVRREIERGRILDGDVEHAVFASWWARLDAPAVFAWSRREAQGGSPRVSVALFSEWAEQDARAAIQAARTDHFPARRQRALAASLIRAPELKETRPQAWNAVLSEIPDRTDRRAALSAVMERRLRSEGVESLLAEVRLACASLEPAVADDVAAGAALEIAQHEPRSAVRLLETILDSGRPLPPGVARDVASVWDDRDPLAAIEWLGSLDTSEEQVEAVRLAFRSWTSEDRTGALAWAAEHVDSTERWLQPVRVSYGFNLGHSDRMRGLELLLSLPGSSQQARFIRHIFAEWKDEDPVAAETWLASADLPGPFKQALRAFEMSFPHKMVLETGEPGGDPGDETDSLGSGRGPSGGGR